MGCVGRVVWVIGGELAVVFDRLDRKGKGRGGETDLGVAIKMR